MAHAAIASDRFTSNPVDDGAAAVAAIVTARREAWERALASGPASPRRCVELRDAAVTSGPEMAYWVWDWRAARGRIHFQREEPSPTALARKVSR